MLYMTDDAVLSTAYEELNYCQLYTFPFVTSVDSIYSLRALKMEKSYCLMSSNDKDGDDYLKCLTEDCSFNIVSANKAIFYKERVTFGAGDNSD